MEEIKFIKVSSQKTIDAVEALAGAIWREHYSPIIGIDQVEYMLEKFQSRKAIKEQIGEGVIYYLISPQKGGYVGYLAFVGREKEFFLSKLYIVSGYRQKGYGKRALRFIEKIAKEKKLPSITLTVNKHNTHSIEVYKKLGFSIIESFVEGVGNGFVRDDYKMEKLI